MTPALPPAITSGAVPVSCVVATAEHYRIPTDVLVAILDVEGGRLGQVSANSNGSYDYGPWQINSTWLPVLRPYGIGASQLRWSGCESTWTAGWILRGCLDRNNNFWRGVGCYHSSTTTGPVDRNARYARKVWRAYQRVRQALIRLKSKARGSRSAGRVLANHEAQR